MTRATAGNGRATVPGEANPTSEKRVSWAELFFDLVFVVAITTMSTRLGRDHSWAGLLRSLIVFVPIYWLWVGTSIQANLTDTTKPALRLRILAVALAGVFMALALPGVYGHDAMVFAAAYWAGRVVLGAPLMLRTDRGFTVPLSGYSVSMLLTGPLLVIGAIVPGPAREAVWGAAAVVDLATPTVLRARLQHLHFDAAHLAERFGLFVLIALGESVVVVATPAPLAELGVGRACATAAAFALSCGLWWVYFHFAADAMRHSLATAKVQLDITRLVLSYGHLSFIAAIIVVAAGLRAAIVAPAQDLTWSVTGLLFGGVALYLATFGFTRWAMFRLVSYTRLTTAAAVLALMPVAPHVPSLVSLTGLAVVLAILNAVELLRVEKSGWRGRQRE